MLGRIIVNTNRLCAYNDVLKILTSQSVFVSVALLHSIDELITSNRQPCYLARAEFVKAAVNELLQAT